MQKNIDIPFFLKDIVYLDFSEPNNYQYQFNTLVNTLRWYDNQQPTVEQNKGVKESLLKARQKALDIEKVFQERERARKNKYIIKLTSIATVVSIFAAGLAIILPLTEINLKDISWVVSFFLGALVSLVVSWILRRRDINRIHKEMTRMSEMRDILSTQIRKKGEEHRYEQ